MERVLLLTRVVDCLGTVTGEQSLQKLVYLVQVNAQFLGYHFSWLNHGPVCMAILKDIREVELLGLVSIKRQNYLTVFASNLDQLPKDNYWRRQVYLQYLSQKSLDIIDKLNSKQERYGNNSPFLALLASLDYITKSGNLHEQSDQFHDYFTSRYSSQQVDHAREVLDLLHTK